MNVKQLNDTAVLFSSPTSSDVNIIASFIDLPHNYTLTVYPYNPPPPEYPPLIPNEWQQKVNKDWFLEKDIKRLIYT